ncbi:MAG: hypothetical protein KME55_35175 [Nostoc indistinguendum CM1-VF10]|jgi:hypothetical protein|nr:hypothetical protein [Nostoc indistinguendum CM1-VF10]
MANIAISNLCPAGSELFHDSESFLYALAEQDIMYILGGKEQENVIGWTFAHWSNGHGVVASSLVSW